MTFYNFLNKTLNKINFNSKTKILIAIIAGGMITIGFLMFISIFAIKYDYETLFKKHTQPQVELEEIRDIYHVNINETLFDLRKSQISEEDALEVIELARQIIQKQWKNYINTSMEPIDTLPKFANQWLSFFLFVDAPPKQNLFQKSIADKIKNKMQRIDEEILMIVELLKQGKTINTDKHIENVTLEINSINIYFASLINTHLKMAISQKEANDALFRTSIYMLVLLISLVFFLSIVISLLLINHFRELHDSLEHKVEEKTIELTLLNTSLEKRIKKEVENSRKKDNIMFQQARLASLGEMLQNIAHQWRQPLGTLSMIVQSFQTKFLAGKLTKELIEKNVDDAMLLAQNMSDTLDDFRNFFNPNKTKNQFSILKVIEKATDLSKYQLEKNDILLHSFVPQDTIIYGFKNELIHVILNLINNSKDALSTKTELKNKKIWITTKLSKSRVLITVIDNGGGVEPALLSKIFDPYFTTKHQSIGTGIGLYMSKQIIEKHMHGKIYCKNIKHNMEDETLYQCASFTISIPIKERKER
ncbi:MAG: HAMP domain-containing sensor histidine kinase [Sulfurospirillaceae bacterium]|nr:HAMP domain-containing sensor histidine kinase [Sulfurospirillaceae bacterium]